jgi:hypothetical protein
VKWELDMAQVFTNTLCIGLRMVNDNLPSIQSVVGQYFMNQQSMGAGSNPRRKLMDSVEIMEKRQATFKEWAADFSVKKEQAMDTMSMVRRYLRVLHATDKSMEMDDRIDDMIQVANYRPSRRVLAEAPPRSEDFTPLQVKSEGWCNNDADGNTMYPCYYGNVCVPVQDRDLCPEPDLNDPQVSTLDRIQYYLHRASLIDIDPEEILSDANQCYRDYEVDLDSVPVTYSNLNVEGGGGEFCVGVTPPFPYRFPSIEIQGINRFVSTGCNVDEINVCTCDFYYSTLVNYNPLTFDFTDADIRIKFINALISVQLFFYATVFKHVPFIQQLWYSILTALAEEAAYPQWFLYVFWDLGIRNVSAEQRWYCFGIYQGSLSYVLLVAFLMYDFFMSLDLFSYWFWSLVQRFHLFSRGALVSYKIPMALTTTGKTTQKSALV